MKIFNKLNEINVYIKEDENNNKILYLFLYNFAISRQIGRDTLTYNKIRRNISIYKHLKTAKYYFI